MASETTVGSIVGFLRLDTTDWDAHIQAAIAQAEALGAVDPNVHIDTNAAEVSGQLAGVAAEAEAAGAAGDHMGGSYQQAGHHGAGGMLRLLQAIAPVIPATIPLAGAAVGVGAAFGAMGAAGVLAFLGIKEQIQEGTAEGQAFSAGIDALKGHLQVLETVAASDILGPFSSTVDSITQHMPYLNGEIDDAATALGSSLASSVDGLLSFMVKLAPALDIVEGGIQHVADEFDDWANSPAASDFVSYLVQNLPIAGQFLSSLATDVKNLIVAFAPIGSTVLHALSGVTTLLSNIPTGPLTVLASLVAGVGTAFLAWRGLRSLIAGVGGALGNLSPHFTALGVGALQAESASSRLSGVLGGVLGVLGIGVAAWSLWTAHQQAAEQQQRRLTDAIKEDNGVVGKNATKVLESSDAYQDAAQQLSHYGVGQDELTAALKGNKVAISDINDKIKENGTVSTSTSHANQELGKQVKKLSAPATDAKNAFNDLQKKVGKSADEAKRAALANQDWKDKTGALTQQQKDMLLAVTGAADATKDQKKAIDALNQSLDAELSKQLQLAGSVTAYQQARADMIAVLKKSTSTTNGNTAAGRKNKQAIEHTVSALQRHRQVSIKNGASVDSATSKYQRQAGQLLKQVAKTDGASSATYKYTKKLLAVPDDVKTRINLPGYNKAMSMAKKYHVRLDNLPPSVQTKIIAETGGAEAALKRTLALIHAIHSKHITISTGYTYSGTPPSGGPGTHIHAGGYANGGIVGPVHAAASGLLAREPMIAAGGSNILWAEPETHGEAYIPFAQSKRPRATAILRETADEFGYQLAPRGAPQATVIVNNPVGEPTALSVNRALQRASSLGAFA